MTRLIYGRLVCAIARASMLVGCAAATRMSVAETTGPAPNLSQPKHSLIPTINVVDAELWPDGSAPDAVVRVPYTAGATQITATPVKVVDLPAGTINHHWTKNILAGAGTTL